MHFYESSIITTKDGLHCQVYSNEHPVDSILVKPKYIPTDKIHSSALQYRYISGKRMNRLNFWAEKTELLKYIEDFKESYPNYVYKSPLHSGKRLFFSVSIDNIERIYFPRRGLFELLEMPECSLDNHLKNVYEFVGLILQCGLSKGDLGVTYSTLMGHYLSSVSDINIVVYGKKNFWKVMNFLNYAKHPKLRWKTEEEWIKFYEGRNRSRFFTKKEFFYSMSRKKSEGFFNNSLFIIFCAENENEVVTKWGEEKYSDKGLCVVEGIVKDNHNSIVRPGFYEIEKSKIISGPKVNVEKVVFYSRDYCMLAFPGEKIRACGILEKVNGENEFSKKEYYRVVVGYFDSYLSDRRNKEHIKVI